MRRSLLALFLGALLFLSFGCSEKLPPDLPKLYPTSVIVIQDGKPLEGATVQLLPKDSKSRWAAGGKTDTSGKVEFFTEGHYRGVPEGDYKVTVSKIFTEPSQYGSIRPDGAEAAAAWDKGVASEYGKLKSYLLVDPVYDSRKTSPLELNVGPKQPKERQIDIGKAFNQLIK
ncbi:MAG: carboxypeptidase-like regulatory domain-containing protein [Planctomycetaceae bacterium]|nr:carboxypeptidase-like regulatory domain-containing protein [Planctomycetaceae bacterium]